MKATGVTCARLFEGQAGGAPPGALGWLLGLAPSLLGASSSPRGPSDGDESGWLTNLYTNFCPLTFLMMF